MAQKARIYLKENGKIDTEKIFIVKTDALSPEGIDKAFNFRISLAIK
jgi:hypothetical protein